MPARGSWKRASREMTLRAQSTPAEGLARRFCLVLEEETTGMQPGTWRVVATIAHRMGVTFEEASAIADDCARRHWADRDSHSIRLREGGRRVGVGKAVVSKQQSARARPGGPANRHRDRQQMTELEKLQHEIYLHGEIITRMRQR
jgi:hypothetical protein